MMTLRLFRRSQFAAGMLLVAPNIASAATYTAASFSGAIFGGGAPSRLVATTEEDRLSIHLIDVTGFFAHSI
jgi:hypothetical protein